MIAHMKEMGGSIYVDDKRFGYYDSNCFVMSYQGD